MEVKNPNPNEKTLAEIDCNQLLGVGPKIYHYLSKCGLQTLQDLLLHLPYRYENRSKLTPINEVNDGARVLIKGSISFDKFKPQGWNRKGFSCQLTDETGSISLRFFHSTRKQSQQFTAGRTLLCYGEVRRKKASFSELEIIHPDYEFIQPYKQLILPRYLTAIYPSTQGLSQRTLHKLIDQIFSLLLTHSSLPLKKLYYFPDYLPKDLLQATRLPNLLQAIHTLHRPLANTPSEVLARNQHRAQQRLALEELLAHSLRIQQIKKNRCKETANKLPMNPVLTQRFFTTLPFQLTAAQKRVIEEISQDIQQSRPMQRLLQGDVGSGKTIVAAFAALQALTNHYQVALMAPTELLSEQHYQQFCRWLTPLGYQVVCLTASQKANTKKQVLAKIKTAQAQLVIGTHALFQAGVHFNNLALIIVDEQHRFGVQQRLALWEKGQQQQMQAHQLFMTATPIPRTLAMTSFTDFAISCLDELPKGRLPVKTVILSDKRRNEVIERVRETCHRQKQVYWVCPLIEKSDSLQCQAAETTFKTLQTKLPGLRLGLIHGRLTATEKESVMRRFKEGNIDLLVATSVIEVGVDVANAHLMIIENAERLGLAQLHQLRGRVGRSYVKGYCVLLYQRLSATAKERLKVMRTCNDGFMIAQRDLELRGPGEVWGLRQTGWQSLRIADLKRDQQLIPHVLKLSTIISEKYPHLIEPIIQRWQQPHNVYCKV